MHKNSVIRLRNVVFVFLSSARTADIASVFAPHHEAKINASNGAPSGSHLWISQGVLIAALCLGLHTKSFAQNGNTVCSAPDPSTLLQGCVSTINVQQFAQTAYETQQASEWCWAASISMMWAFYGYQVAQSEIVTGTFWPASKPRRPTIADLPSLERTTFR